MDWLTVKSSVKSMGRLTVITGCMGSGKTSKLLSLIADHKRKLDSSNSMTKPFVACVKPNVDSRAVTIQSRDGREIEAIPVESPWDYYVSLATTLLVIDEAQFFDADELEDYVSNYIRSMDIIVSGLSSDFTNSPFGGMGKVLSTADEIIHLTAICNRCGGTATRTHRLTDEIEQVVVGGDNIYESLCSDCWDYV